MAEYIKREAAICKIEQINPVDYGAMWDYEAHHYAGECLRDCKEAIDSIPAADVALVVHGRWIHDGRRIENGIDWCHCSERGKSDNFCARTNYCPKCDAKMME